MKISALILPLLVLFNAARAETNEVEVCVYGATAAGVIAAVEAARLGRRVLLMAPGRHLGGMTSGGLGETDFGNKAAIGGLAREFYRRVGRRYGKPEQWEFEPHAAEDVFFEMVNEAKAPVYFAQRLVSVEKRGRRIAAAHFDSGRVVRAREFIDATYEGDLMALAGVAYIVGREPNSAYGETLDGIRGGTPKHQFLAPIDPYRQPGRPESGLLPFIQAVSPGVPGAGDHSVQAYNFRLVLTKDPANQKPISPPPGYDPARYELLARYIEALEAAGKKVSLGDFMDIHRMPHGKTDINNNGGFSTDDIGANYAYPDGNAAVRQRIWTEHENYTRGFLHFLATSPRVPATLRKQMQAWGLTRDEFLDTGGWPRQLYVREARRMISDYVMTEHNCRGAAVAPDSIGLASYGMDSHNCRRLARNGRVENEGDVQAHGFPPFPIAYRSIAPKPAQCENLLVPVCLSATHIAYGSIRMEPVFMILGQSAAAAAAAAIDENCAIQKIDIPKLQRRLRAEHQILAWIGAKPSPAVFRNKAEDQGMPAAREK